MYKYILFDLDGTLTDPCEGITKCFQYALNACDIEEDCDNLLKVIGPPLLDSFMNFYNMNEERAEYATSKYRERFSTVGLYENNVYDGISDLLNALKEKGYILAVATSKPTVYAKQILEHFNLLSYFELVVGSGLDNKTLNTKTKVIAKVLEDLNISDNEKNVVVMIGDRKQDIIGAKECGIASIGVRFGYAEDGELEEAGADYIVANVGELEELLTK